MNKLLSAIVLIISVLLFRCRFNGKKSQKVVANEKVMVVHVTLFISYFIAYVSQMILFSYYLYSEAGKLKECRLYLT